MAQTIIAILGIAANTYIAYALGYNRGKHEAYWGLYVKAQKWADEAKAKTEQQ